MRENVHARGEQHDHVQPAAADPAQQLRKATSEEPAGGSEHGQSNEGPGEPLPPENPSVPRDNNSLESPADAGKTRRTLESDQPSSPSRRIRRHKDRLRPRQAGKHAGSGTDRAKGRDADARDAIGKRSRNGQDKPQTTKDLFLNQRIPEQIAELHADPDLDPIRKAHAIAQLAANLPVLVEQLDKKRAADQDLAVRTAGAIDKLISNVHEVFADQVEALSANPDLDPLKKAQAIARLASEELRLRALHSRRVAEAIPSFDFVAMMEQALKEAQPRIEELKRLARSQEALAENSADERDGRFENPSPGGTTSTGS